MQLWRNLLCYEHILLNCYYVGIDGFISNTLEVVDGSILWTRNIKNLEVFSHDSFQLKTCAILNKKLIHSWSGICVRIKV